MKKIKIILAGQGVKCNGSNWRINKNDRDTFPSDPHAHHVNKAEKLNLYTGEVVSSKHGNVLRKLPKKEMLQILSAIMSDGEPDVTEKLERNKAKITFLSPTKAQQLFNIKGSYLT